jgi:hypothetical protein
LRKAAYRPHIYRRIIAAWPAIRQRQNQLGIVVTKEEYPREKSSPNSRAVGPRYWAMDYYFDNLKKVVLSAPSGGTEFGEKLKGYVEENIAATHYFIKQLSQARDFEDVLRLQNEFIRSHLKAFEEQAKSFGESFTKSAHDIFDKTSS